MIINDLTKQRIWSIVDRNDIAKVDGTLAILNAISNVLVQMNAPGSLTPPECFEVFRAVIDGMELNYTIHMGK